MNKTYKIVLVTTLISIVILVTGISYAYFSATITGNSEEITIKSGDFELTFTDSLGIYFDNDIRPGTSASKTFTVQNTGTADDKYTYAYNIKLTELTVTFEKKDLVYTLQEYTNDNYTDLKEGGVNKFGYINLNTVNKDNEMYLAINIERPPKGTIHYYKLTIEFKSLEGVNQNYNQGKTFGGKINVDDNREAALYIPPTPFSEIIKVDNPNIFEDDFENIRYAGPSAEVNNYIWFNCNDYKNLDQETAKTTCEKWRIIGLFKNVTEANGSIENLVKIIRDAGVGEIALDSNNSNNWANATLKTSLESYYDGNKLNTANGIKESTKGMIEKVTWNLGGANTNRITAKQFYEYERKDTVPSGASATWNGYIGLMYPSDYGYATTGSTTGNDRADCLATTLWDYNSRSYCYEKDWLYRKMTQWTLTPYSPNSFRVFGMYYAGQIDIINSSNSNSVVFPSLYLTSDVGIVSGDGTSDIPYIIKSA